jgi:transcriptional regulator with XRE-family HTH domain
MTEGAEFGSYLRELRTAARKSLRQVQREVGIAPAYLSLIETGKRRPPYPEFLRRLAICYNTPPSQVFRRAGYIEGAAPTPDEVRAAKLAVMAALCQLVNLVGSGPTQVFCENACDLLRLGDDG